MFDQPRRKSKRDRPSALTSVSDESRSRKKQQKAAPEDAFINRVGKVFLFLGILFLIFNLASLGKGYSYFSSDVRGGVEIGPWGIKTKEPNPFNSRPPADDPYKAGLHKAPPGLCVKIKEKMIAAAVITIFTSIVTSLYIAHAAYVWCSCCNEANRKSPAGGVRCSFCLAAVMLLSNLIAWVVAVSAKHTECEEARNHNFYYLAPGNGEYHHPLRGYSLGPGLKLLVLPFWIYFFGYVLLWISIKCSWEEGRSWGKASGGWAAEWEERRRLEEHGDEMHRLDRSVPPAAVSPALVSTAALASNFELANARNTSSSGMGDQGRSEVGGQSTFAPVEGTVVFGAVPDQDEATPRHQQHNTDDRSEGASMPADERTERNEPVPTVSTSVYGGNQTNLGYYSS